ncbi:MAG: hypothetical protein HN413_16560 [Chloroflexi bacterium]|jgi:hypothetical protein|nr:hypothetical protein [Chloroflexota bacterium]
MSRKQLSVLILIALVFTSLACSLSSLTGGQAEDTQATIDAAIAATSTAQAELEAQINQTADEAVDEAMQELEEEYLLMTEEEFNQAIDEAITEATTATEQTVYYVEEASSDGTLTQEEIEQIEYYAYYADDLIYMTEELIYAYYGLYAELAYETIYLLEAVEDDLSQMAAAMTEITNLTVAAAETLAAGMEVRQETIDGIITAAQGTAENIQNIAPEWQSWADAIQGDRATRLQSVQEIAANFIPEDRLAALNETLNFADAVRNALGDYSISQIELFDIAQFGANAVAGLQAHGGPQLQDLAGNIGNITNNLALGQTPNALNNLGALEGSIRNVPNFSVPDRPEFSPPSAPSIPSPGGGRGGRRP